MPFVSDTFSGTNGTALQSRTGEIGATWTKRTDTGSYDWAVNGGSAYYGGPATYGIRYAASGVPASAEYDIEAVFECLSVVNSYPGICGRFQAGVDTNYQVVYNGGTWSLYKVVAGANTLLGSHSSSFTSGTRTVKLELRNATKRVYFDGSSSPAISSTDNAITNAGAVGITDYLVASRTATTGYRLQSIVASDAEAGGGTSVISSDLAIKWDMLNTIASDLALRWDIFATTASDLTLLWDIRDNELTSVSSDLALVWDAFAPVNSDLSLNWDTLQQVFSDLAVKWDVYQTVSGDLTILFDVRNLVESDLALIWDAVGRVSSNLTLRWDLGDNFGRVTIIGSSFRRFIG